VNTIPSDQERKKCRVGPVFTSLTRSDLFWITTWIPIAADILALFTYLNLEEQVAYLIDYFGVSAGLTARKALIGGEDKI
jgi:hypothetical protein